MVGLQEETPHQIEAVLHIETCPMLLVTNLDAECLQQARLGRLVSSRERRLDTCREGAVVFLLKHLRADVVMHILRTHNQAVLSPENGCAMPQLERASVGR